MKVKKWNISDSIFPKNRILSQVNNIPYSFYRMWINSHAHVNRSWRCHLHKLSKSHSDDRFTLRRVSTICNVTTFNSNQFLRFVIQCKAWNLYLPFLFMGGGRSEIQIAARKLVLVVEITGGFDSIFRISICYSEKILVTLHDGLNWSKRNTRYRNCR